MKNQHEQAPALPSLATSSILGEKRKVQQDTLLAYTYCNEAVDGVPPVGVKYGLYRTETPSVRGETHYVDKIPPSFKSWVDSAKAQALLQSGKYTLVGSLNVGQQYYATPEVAIGKHEWRMIVKESERGYGRVTEYQFRIIGADQWRPDSEWPTYNPHDGTYAGCPKSLRAKVFDPHRAQIDAAVDGKPVPDCDDLFATSRKLSKEEYQQEFKRLEAAIAKAKAHLKESSALAEKIERKAAVRAAEESLRQHKLNYFELVDLSQGRSEAMQVTVSTIKAQYGIDDSPSP